MSLPLVTAPEIFRKTVRYCSKRAVISLLKNRRISGFTFYLWGVTWSFWCWWMLLQGWIFLFYPGIDFLDLFEITCFVFSSNFCQFFGIFYVLRRYWCIFCWFCPFFGCVPFFLFIFFDIMELFFGQFCHFLVSIFWDVYCVLFGWFCPFLGSVTFFSLHFLGRSVLFWLILSISWACYIFCVHLLGHSEYFILGFLTLFGKK